MEGEFIFMAAKSSSSSSSRDLQLLKKLGSLTYLFMWGFVTTSFTGWS